MGKKVKEYKSGDYIFAKVKGYPAWPARVQRPNGKKYFVYFYGTGETANLPPNQIFDYAENKDKFLNKTIKRKDFNDGVQQIEHDFANNVPLEDVIGGAIAEPMDTTANDTGVESVNDSALNDTADVTADETANDTVDEASTTAEAPAVEDSDDGALVIDEGKKKKPGPKGTPKAAPKEPKTPRGKAKKEEAEKPSEEEKKDEELVSRSGRKIRPKRFVDEHTEENATLPSPAAKKRRGSPAPADKPPKNDAEPPKRQYQALTQSELEDIKEPVITADAEKDHILVACLPSGQYVGVKLFQSKPTFKNDAARLQWYRQAAANAITLKSQLEKGHITSSSVSAQIETDLNLSEEERANLDKEREIEEKKSRVQFLKTEMKLIELDAKIKSCLSLEKADTELCLKLIDELMELEIRALMLLKHPTCVETLRRMRAYVGNTPSWELSETDQALFTRRAQVIRKNAEKAYRRFKELFSPPSGLSFWEFFSERVQQFNKYTTKLSADELLEMVHEPIELSLPSSNTMRAAIDSANSAPAETEEKEKPPATPKKRGAPAKNKKAAAAPTPSKTPKRNSARNKPQAEAASDNTESTENSEDKEKETAENTEKPAVNTEEKEPETTENTDKPEEAVNTEVAEKNSEESTEKETEEKSLEAEKEVTSEEKEEKEAEKSDKPTENGDANAKETEAPTADEENATEEVEKSNDAEKETKDAEKTTKEADKGTKLTVKSSKNAEKGTKDADKTTKVAEKSSKNTEKGTKDAEKVTKDDKATKDSEKVTKESEKATKDSEKATKVAEKSAKDLEKATKVAEKAAKDAEKAAKDGEKPEGEPRAKRVRESTRKEAPPPKSPLKRKSKS